MNWLETVHSPRRREVHHGDRLVSCFVDRWPHLWAMIDAAARRNPDGEAIVFGQGRTTWADLVRQAAGLAACFAARGVGSGDRIAILVGNRPEFIIALFAAFRLGAVAVPLSTRYQTPEIEYALNDCGAALLVHDADLTALLPQVAALPASPYRLVSGGNEWQQAVRHGPGDDAGPPVHEDDTAVILYTSGTTGRPKGAMLSHLGLINSCLVYRGCFGLTQADRTLAAVPMAHVTGLVANVLAMAACAGTVVVLPAFKAAAFLALAASERITHTILAPTMYKLCLMAADFDRHDLSAWRIGGFGGAPMPEAVIADFSRRLPGLRLMNAYGATETTSPSAILPPEMTASRPASVGLAVPNCDIVVMDDNGCEVARGEAGEIWIRGPSVVRGYWNKPQADADSFLDGFWRSGDIGSIDADGFVHVLDRKKDMINRGGLKIFSAEVENVLASHPAISESAVVGKPCPVLGERVHAFVSVKDAIDAEVLRTFLQSRLSDYKVPETFTVSAAPLPRNSNGKILKRDLKADLLRQIAGDAIPD